SFHVERYARARNGIGRRSRLGPSKNLSISTKVKSLISLLTVDEKILHLSDNTSVIPRLGLPAYEWWSESLHGIDTNGPGINFNGPIKGSTNFSQAILTAVAFNQTLWHSITSAIADEAEREKEISINPYHIKNFKKSQISWRFSFSLTEII
ncbi:hypothetical protein HAX54_052561, partial [Datura stramonium]|nr:hypothetical protein [Datura stramonium]